MPQILIVEDEAAIADTLVYALQAEGFATRWVTLAGEALALLEDQAFDLAILDVGLPDISGFEACKRLRRFSEVPVIFLTARSEEIDRVVGLEIGADDYVVKPFSPREVAARVRAILKRMVPRAGIESSSALFVIDSDRVLSGTNGFGAFLFNFRGTRETIGYRGNADLANLGAMTFGLERVGETYFDDTGSASQQIETSINSAYSELAMAPSDGGGFGARLTLPPMGPRS